MQCTNLRTASQDVMTWNGGCKWMEEKDSTDGKTNQKEIVVIVI